MKALIDNKVAQSTKWSGITEFLSRLLGPVTNAILARLLAPEIFGIVATFTMVVSFAEVFTDAGFQKYLVQHEFRSKEDKEKATNVAFWTNFGFSCLIWVVICVFRNQIAALVGSEGYGTHIMVMSLNIPLVALSSIQLALYRRDFKFKQLLPVRLASGLMPLVVTVPLAAIFHNAWSIVIGNIAKEAALAVLLTVKSDWKPRLYYSIGRLKAMLGFSVMLLIDSVIIWLTSYSDTFIVSQFLDSYHIGIYKTGSTTITVYMNLLYTITAPVLFSALSRLQGNKAESDKIYYNFQRYCGYLIIPLGVGVFVYRDFVTSVLLGSQWEEASLILGGTALSLAFSIITAQYNSDYYRAMGKPSVSLVVQSIYAVIMLTSISIAAQYSFVALCVTKITLSFIYAIISTVAIRIMFKVSVRRILLNIVTPATGAVVMALVGVLLQNVSGSLLWSVFSVGVCVGVYGIIILIIPSSRKDILSLDIIKNILKRKTD